MNPSTLEPLDSLAKERRKHAIGIALATVAAGLPAIAGILALFDTRFTWQPAVRIFLVAALVTTSLVFLLRRLRAASGHDPMEAARTVESAHPGIGQKLRTALDISRRQPDPASPEADDFRKRLLSETGESLRHLPLRSLVPKRAFHVRLGSALAVLAALMVVSLLWGDFRHALKRFACPHLDLTYTRIEWRVLPKSYDESHPPRLEFTVAGRAARPELSVRQPGGDWETAALTNRHDGRTWDVILSGKTSDLEVKVRAGDTRSGVLPIVWRPVPKLIDSHATVSFPDYTGLDEETSPGGDVHCVEGSTAGWSFTFAIAPRRVTWSIGGEEAVELPSGDGGTSYTVSSEVKIGKTHGELAIFDDDGEKSDAWRFEIEGIADRLPEIGILEPAGDLELISTAELPIRIRATDDFGVAEIGLILDAGGERRWVLETVVDERNQRQVSELVSLMLEQIPLEITDNVRIHAYALDHKPRGGPRAVSPLLAIDIRQFKIRWYYNEGGGGMGSAAAAEALMRLDQIIGVQRGVLSDLFSTRESFRGSVPPEVLESAAALSGRESELSENTAELEAFWVEEDEIPADDIALLGTAASQMAEAAGLIETPDLDNGFVSADRALSTLLRLRKEIVRILTNSQSPDSGQEPPAPPLASLAEEARRLAAEERDVADQLPPDAPSGNQLAALLRQQEVALADIGELYARLVDHPERSEGALRLMDESEKAAAMADSLLRSEEPAAASPALAEAERSLLDLAIFLESLDLQRLSDTLRELADNAERASRAEQEEAGAREDGSPQGGSPGQTAENAARAAGLAGEILEELAEKAGGQNSPGDGESERSAAEAALEVLRERTDPAGLAEELGALAERQREGEGDDDGDGLTAGASQRLGEMVREFREAAAALDASRLAELNRAREEAGALREALAEEGREEGEGSGDGEESGEGGKGEPASNDGEGQDPGEGDGRGGGGQEDDVDGAPGRMTELDRFAGTIDNLRDEGGLGRLVTPLRSAPFDRSAIPLVDAADVRLQELIELIPSDPGVFSARGKPPEASRRDIEAYFRDLSDDFGDEDW